MAKYLKFDKEAWEHDKAERKAKREERKAANADKKLGKRVALAGGCLGVAATAAVTAVKIYSMYQQKQAMADFPVEDAGDELPVETVDDVTMEVGA